MASPKSCQEDSPPLPRKGRGRMKVQTAHSPAALISAVVIDPKKSRRQLYLQNPFLDLQAKEADSAGDSKSGESNSSDDQNESDLSCISHGQDHENAERYVYLSSQTNLHTPIHQKRASEEGRVPLAGESTMCICPFANIPVLTYRRCDPG